MPGGGPPLSTRNIIEDINRTDLSNLRDTRSPVGAEPRGSFATTKRNIQLFCVCGVDLRTVQEVRPLRNLYQIPAGRDLSKEETSVLVRCGNADRRFHSAWWCEFDFEILEAAFRLSVENSTSEIEQLLSRERHPKQ